ncbi:MAG: hypothetical protein WAW80_04760 [Candidatus Saccharimonadales bacterium]
MNVDNQKWFQVLLPFRAKRLALEAEMRREQEEQKQKERKSQERQKQSDAFSYLIRWSNEDDALLDDEQFTAMREYDKEHKIDYGEMLVYYRERARQRQWLKSQCEGPIDASNVVNITHMLVDHRIYSDQFKHEYTALVAAVVHFAPSWMIDLITVAYTDEDAYAQVVQLMTEQTGSYWLDVSYEDSAVFPHFYHVKVSFVGELDRLGADISGIVRAYAGLQAAHKYHFPVGMRTRIDATLLVTHPGWIQWQLQLLVDLETRYDRNRNRSSLPERNRVRRLAQELITALESLQQPVAAEAADAS